MSTTDFSSASLSPSSPPETEAAFDFIVSDLSQNEKELTVKVATKTNVSDYKTSSFFCVRSYTDFLWLSEEISQQHPGCIVPVLPPKFSHKTSSHSEQTFCLSLRNYLLRLAEHPVLHKDPNFQKFLEGEPITFVRKTQTQMFGETGKELITGMMKKGSEQDTYFEDKRAFVSIHENNMKTALKTLERQHKLAAGLGSTVKDLSFKFISVSECTTEDSLATGIRKCGKAFDEQGEISIQHVDKSYDHFAEYFHQGIRDLQACKNALDNRLEMSSNYDKAMKNTKNKREAYEKLRGNPQSKADKLSKAQADVAEAEKLESDTKDLFFNTTENLKNEFSLAEKERVKSFKANVAEVIEMNLAAERKILQIFEELRTEVELISA